MFRGDIANDVGYDVKAHRSGFIRIYNDMNHFVKTHDNSHIHGTGTIKQV